MSAATPMQEAVERYLQDRRRLGFALTAPATESSRDLPGTPTHEITEAHSRRNCCWVGHGNMCIGPAT